MIQSLSHTFKAFSLDWLMLPSAGKAAIAIELVEVFFFPRGNVIWNKFPREENTFSMGGPLFFTFYFVDEV